MQVKFGMNGTSSVGLTALGDLPNYRVCAGDIDPRGWCVVDSNGAVLGEATDLIVDLDGLIARYMVCSLKRGDARAVLIPTGFLRLEKEETTVYLDFVTVEDALKLPAFERLPLSAEHISEIEKVLTGNAPPTPSEPKIVRRNDVTRDAH